MVSATLALSLVTRRLELHSNDRLGRERPIQSSLESLRIPSLHRAEPRHDDGLPTGGYPTKGRPHMSW